MKRTGKLIATLLMMFFISVSVYAGDLEPPAGEPEPTMYTLGEIFDKLDAIDAVISDTNSQVKRELSPVAKTGAQGRTGYTFVAGEDGDLNKGVAIPSPRFSDNGNGTVTDNLTGLIWLNNASAAAATRNWATALSDVAQLNTDGKMNSHDCCDTSNSDGHQIDWRLPNIKELQSLIDFGNNIPALPSGHPFTNVQSGCYWSGTSCAHGTGDAWYVGMGYGNVYYDDESNNGYVWPVRGGND